jgi:hypothetical protein
MIAKARIVVKEEVATYRQQHSKHVSAAINQQNNNRTGRSDVFCVAHMKDTL